ncbi:hypothetical protein HN385_04925 [archaeon]|jgi:hypothetical protein|nr:hypothetical protein [archaeon]MBT3451310.1 hypothetical protein [archaeon]MBT6869288.1 hypothetical protein [archaeon]MBT7381202.1 hypothetical protein [archaeon]MBT7508549.1 hypothetical protein [archaeon]
MNNNGKKRKPTLIFFLSLTFPKRYMWWFDKEHLINVKGNKRVITFILLILISLLGIYLMVVESFFFVILPLLFSYDFYLVAKKR